MHSKLAGLHVEVAAYHAGPSTPGPELRKDVVHGAAELLPLLNGWAVVAIDRGHAAGIAFTKVDNCGRRAAAPLAAAPKLHLLPAAWLEKHGRQADIARANGCHVAKRLRLGQQLLLGGPDFLHQGNVRPTSEG